MMVINEILNKSDYSREDIISLLSANSPGDAEAIKERAYAIMKENCGENVYLRGLIEFSNICVNDCYYCGIRKSNQNVKRYTLTHSDVIDSAKWCAEQGYGSLVLQSGERSDPQFVDMVVNLVKEIKQGTRSSKLPDGLGITLCVGEQTAETYRRFFEAGAHRYLLRIESSNRALFGQIHPDYQDFDRRIECLSFLRQEGFQVGTGVMIGLPGQTIENLADDILFFKSQDVDMIGMGPFIVHNETPYRNLAAQYEKRKEEIYNLALRMIAVTRIVLKDVNIASTTALQAMYPFGRESGLMHGANVMMPLLTPMEVRASYQLYEGKPCLDDYSSACFDCVKLRIESIGRTVALDEYGDSHHFKAKKST